MVNRNPRQKSLFSVTIADIAQMSGMSRFRARRYLINRGLLPPNSRGRKAVLLMETIKGQDPELFMAIQNRAVSDRLRSEMAASWSDLGFEED